MSMLPSRCAISLDGVRPIDITISVWMEMRSDAAPSASARGRRLPIRHSSAL